MKGKFDAVFFHSLVVGDHVLSGFQTCPGCALVDFLGNVKAARHLIHGDLDNVAIGHRQLQGSAFGESVKELRYTYIREYRKSNKKANFWQVLQVHLPEADSVSFVSVVFHI